MPLENRCFKGCLAQKSPKELGHPTPKREDTKQRLRAKWWGQRVKWDWAEEFIVLYFQDRSKVTIEKKSELKCNWEAIKVSNSIKKDATYRTVSLSPKLIINPAEVLIISTSSDICALTHTILLNTSPPACVSGLGTFSSVWLHLNRRSMHMFFVHLSGAKQGK